MESLDFYKLFQGFGTIAASSTTIIIARFGLMILGALLVYLGKRGILEPLLMIPMGIGMAAINAGVMFMPDGTMGNLFLDPMVSEPDQLMNIMQIDFLQPIYVLMFSNGLIACFVFMGIGAMLDVSYLLDRPFSSMFLAMFGELGTFLTIPLSLIHI